MLRIRMQRILVQNVSRTLSSKSFARRNTSCYRTRIFFRCCSGLLVWGIP